LTWKGFFGDLKNFFKFNYIFYILICLLSFFSVIVIFELLKNLPPGSLPALNITEKIEIVGIASLAIGILIYTGSNKALIDNYSLISVGFNSKTLIMIYGSPFIFLFALCLYILSKNPNWTILLMILALILILSIGFIGTGYVLGKYIQIPALKNTKVTLRKIVRDPLGNTISERLPNLHLYQTTDVDYRFNDDNGKEYIIPMEQVQEIKKE
jgi:hypothetical protein